jgi:phytoene desaturase
MVVKKKTVAVIGSGFSGLAASCYLAKEGYSVTVFEKNDLPGGRARKFEAHGFRFDMGPSWYWMPEIFEDFFRAFGKTSSDYYILERLDPSYRVYFAPGDFLDIPAGQEALEHLFEQHENGSSVKLRKFLEEARFKYELGMNNLVHKPGLSLTEFLDKDLFTGLFRLHVFRSLSSHVRKYFKHPRLIQLMEFPVLFLGATPQKTPALYSLMNYADMVLGTWYPKGGMFKIVEGMVSLARELGVTFRFNTPVQHISLNGTRAKGLVVDGDTLPFDYIIAGADYHHVEQHLLPETHRNYKESYWQKRTLAPSSLIFYMGVRKKMTSLLHHTLFFDADFGQHAHFIYENPQWPDRPQFYLSCASRTDGTVAPPDSEAIMVLIPVAPDLKDSPEVREKYQEQILSRLEHVTGESIRPYLTFVRSYAHNDFIQDYNAFKGNAYGLANTLWQTAHLKPKIINRHVPNLFYTGQLTVPGPGVPPALISGKLAAQLLIKNDKQIA